MLQAAVVLRAVAAASAGVRLDGYEHELKHAR